MRRGPVFGLAASLGALSSAGWFSPGATASAASQPSAASNAQPYEVPASVAVTITTNPATKIAYVVEKTGTLRRLGLRLGAPSLNITSKVSTGAEQGFLGAAFSPDGTWLYTNHTNKSGDTEITAWPFARGVAKQQGKRVLLSIAQPYSNHNGGQLVVDRAGVLWIGTGDGGSSGDPKDNAQNLKSLLGKILRIEPTPTAAKPYTTPAGNLRPDRGRPEIWAFGLRNPWTFSLDETRGRIWIADVGQNDWEEINMVTVDTPNPNFGWPSREGRHSFRDRDTIPGSIDPIHDYEHGSSGESGCSVSGGVLVESHSSLRFPGGSYVYTDYCDSTLRVLDVSGTVQIVGEPMGSVNALSGADGAVFVLSTDKIRRLKGWTITTRAAVGN